jgi:hypothetical protein
MDVFNQNNYRLELLLDDEIIYRRQKEAFNGNMGNENACPIIFQCWMQALHWQQMQSL